MAEKVDSKTISLFVVVLLVAALGNLSQTALNAMLGPVSADFGVDISVGQLLTTVYMMVMGVSVFLVGYLGKRLTIYSSVVLTGASFLLGSALSYVAPNFACILIGRVLQGFSAGVTVTMMQTIAMVRFPRSMSATAMGFAGIAMGFAPNIGPVISGAMVDTVGWRSFFLLMIVLSALLLIAGMVLVEKGGPTDSSVRFDGGSFVLACIGFGGMLLGLSNASSYGLDMVRVWAVLAVGVVFMVAFLVLQTKKKNPLVNLDIFKSRHYRRGTAMLCLLQASFMGVTLVIPLWWMQLCGGTALEAGIILLPGTVAAFAINPLAGYLSDKLGVRPVVLVFSAFLAVGALGMVFLDASTPLWVAIAWQGIRQIGVSGLMSPLISWSFSGLGVSIMNSGTGFSMALRQAFSAFGTACMVYIVLVLTPVDLPLSFHASFGFSAALSVLVFVCALIYVRVYDNRIVD